MKKIGFIGAYDKIDFVMYIAKILVESGKKVLIVDGTILQKAKYIVPSIKPSKTYITEFEGIDVAIGFDSFDNIKQYLALPAMAKLPYDIALVDIDRTDAADNFRIEEFDQNYFVTSFDMYSIKKGMESICNIDQPIIATKVLFTNEMSKEEDDYLNFLSLGSKIKWEEERIYFPFEVGDQAVIYNNQRVAKIKFKKLSNQYKEGLIYIATKILIENENEEVNPEGSMVNNKKEKMSEKEAEELIRKSFKKIEKGV